MMSGKACLRGGQDPNRRSEIRTEEAESGQKTRGGDEEKRGRKRERKNRNEGAQNVINHKYR